MTGVQSQQPGIKKKVPILIRVIISLSILSLIGFLITLFGFNNLDSILQDPLLTPVQYLASHPHVSITVGNFSFIWSEPSSTLLVYLLGVLTIVIGILLSLKKANSDDPPKYIHFVNLWGIALIIWGLGTMLAGTSYQAFFYELKCRDQDYCLWTTWWEIGYLALTVISVNGMVVAQSYLRKEKTQKLMIIYAGLNLLIYLWILIIGMLTVNSILLSFEVMVIFQLLSFILMMIQNIFEHKNTKSSIELNLIKIWIILAIVMAIYFGFYYSGIPEWLWSKGIWFNANDILHVGLIGWMLYIYMKLKKVLHLNG